ncbi:MAG: DNA double-strand break repair nuclease NurA [Actinomycetes bacterium]
MSAAPRAGGGPGSRVVVEPWDPSYGSPVAGSAFGPDAEPEGTVDVSREVDPSAWTPRTPGRGPATTVVVVDGVRRVDARLWVTDDRGTHAGLAGSCAAGTVVCGPDGARLGTVAVRRLLVAPADVAPIHVAGAPYEPHTVPDDDPDGLVAAVQDRMRELEAEVVADTTGAELVLVDGPLRGRTAVENAVGYVKTHRVAYLPPVVADVVADLSPGQRTPLFLTRTSWARWSCYVRLPHADGHPWAGVVRIELPATLDTAAAVERADLVAATLPRLASTPHRDPRAPQNLLPIGGLEQALRRRLGDPALLYRALRSALR